MGYGVLIVEDERIVARDLQETLGDMGYDAYAIASSADEAVAKISERCPDVVLMDIRIKGKRDGIETAALLRERFELPVIYLTAHADEATIDRAKRTSPHGYLLKPVNTGELRGAIESSVYRHRLEKRARDRERWSSTTRLPSLESMAAGVAHELNNPLAVVMASTDLALEELERARAGGAAGLQEAKQLLEELHSSAARMGKIVGDLKAFARPVHRSFGQSDVRRAVEWSVRATSHELRDRARVEVKVGNVPPARADESRLGQVLVNLLVNAAHAIAPGNAGANHVLIECGMEDGRIAIKVGDTGCGMAPDVLARAFEPFFTTRATRRQHGLGPVHLPRHCRLFRRRDEGPEHDRKREHLQRPVEPSRRRSRAGKSRAARFGPPGCRHVKGQNFSH
jgi:C4-dicarboxylate-specific signal transduction histidine kinase